MRRPAIFPLVTTLLLACSTTPAKCQNDAATQPQTPNVVLIVADDLGWTDLGCYGSKYYQTPNIDRLSTQGLRFTQAYSAGPNCAPTRACLMSGNYTPRHGIYTVTTGARGKSARRQLQPPANKTELDTSWVTLAEKFQSAGYTTAHFGKWHLGDPGTTGPREQGFDFNFGGFHAGHPKSYFSPYANPQLPDGPAGENLTDRLGHEVARFINTHADQPFFAYVPFYAVHTPIQAKPELTRKYADKPTAGGHANPKYAAMIETMDNAVGTILDQLETSGLSDSTLVVFTSDNGGLGGYADAGIEGGQEITSQAPLRGGKGMLYEGGVRVPLIVRWPGNSPANQTRSQLVTSVDFYPTLCQIANIEVSESLDGVDLSESWKTSTDKPLPRSLFWHFPGYLEANARRGTWRTTPGGSIRRNEWKLIEFFEDGRLELYNLKDDIGEQHNLAKTHPEITTDLHRELLAWRKQTAAPMPVPNPNYQPK